MTDRAALDALSAHHALYDKLSDPIVPMFFHAMVAQIVGRETSTDETRALVGTCREALAISETFWVSRDMTQVMTHAARGLDDLDRFSHDLWPAEAGFLVFQDSWYVKEVHGDLEGFKAMQWFRSRQDGKPGCFVFMYSDRTDLKDAVTAKWHARADERVRAAWDRLGALQPAEVWFIPDGTNVGPPQVPAPDDGLVQTDNPDRVVLALLMLLGQTITVHTRHDLKPTNATHARKMPLPGQVTVIRLRRESGIERGEGESHVEWHHRWVVRGHWRSQRCGPDYPLAQEVGPGQYRARIYIAPFIKGPDGLPLIVTEKVSALVR